jgi:hypothetical protein
MSGASVLNWNKGYLNNVTVNTDPTASINVGNPIDPQLSNLQMTNTSINVEGSLNWTNSSVLVQPGSSNINIKSAALFKITTSNSTWGGGSPTFLNIMNEAGGNVSLNTSETDTITGNYTTYGTTQIIGSLILNGLAEQGGGQFNLGSYTPSFGILPASMKQGNIKVSNSSLNSEGNPISDVLGIRNGTLSGYGTINGNLNIGNDPRGIGYDKLPLQSRITNPVLDLLQRSLRMQQPPAFR